MPPEFLRPPGLPHQVTHSQVVVTHQRAGGRTIYVAGQVGADATGELVSLGFEAQAERAFENLGTALAAAGARMRDVVKLTLYIRNATDFAPLPALLARHFGTERPPAATLLVVHALARAQALVEVEAVAVVE